MKKILLLVLLSVPAVADYDPSDDLNMFFGASCESFNGPQNGMAAAQAGYIKTIISSKMSNPACAGVSAALESLGKLDLGNLQQENEMELSIEQLRDQSQLLEATLRAEEAKASPDTDYIDDLKMSLRDINIQLIKSKASPNAISKQRRLDAIDSLHKYTLNLFTELEMSAKCSGEHPNLGAQVGAQVLSLTSHFASGFMAPILMAAGSVIDRYVKYLKNRPLANQYKKVVDSRMSQAIGCGIEGLAATYCQARDMQAVVKYTATNVTTFQSNAECTPQDQGAKLIGIDLPSFSSWVSRLTAGSAPTSPAQGTEKKEAVQLKADFEKSIIDLDGRLAKSTRKLAGGGGVDQKAELTSLIKDMTAIVKAGMGRWTSDDTKSIGPYSALFATDPSCGPMAFLYTNGANKQCQLLNETEDCLQCVQRLYGGGTDKVPTLEELKNAKKVLVDSAGPSIAAETALSQESNPQLVLTKAFGLGSNNRRPIDFLFGAKTYLGYLKDQDLFKTGARAETVADLIKRVDESVCILSPETKDCPVSALKSAADKVTALTDIVSPSRDLFYISNALYELVKQDLDERINKGTVDKSLALVMQLSAADSLGELVSNQIGLDSSNSKAMYAKGQTLKNLQSMGDLFSGQIVEGLKNAKQENSETLALDCARALSIPSAPMFGKNDITKYCSGQVWTSIRDPSIKLSFDDIVKVKPTSERTCSIYDFYRKSKVRSMRTR